MYMLGQSTTDALSIPLVPIELNIQDGTHRTVKTSLTEDHRHYVNRLTALGKILKG